MISTPQRITSRMTRLLVAAAAMLIFGSLIAVGSSWTGQEARPQPNTNLLKIESELARWTSLLERAPGNAQTQAQLGLLLLSQARSTADPVLYTQAQELFQAALNDNPEHIDALAGQGMLALSRHHFTDALNWADRALAVTPYRADVLGIRVDALVELGRYAEAVQQAQQMVDLRPGLEAYARISYLRELHGDAEGAIAAMQAAVDAGVPNEERTLWSRLQLGYLHLRQGDLERANATFTELIAIDPGYLHAEAGLARIDMARGDQHAAIERYQRVVERLPEPGYVIALGELFIAAGRQDAAASQFRLATALQQLNIAAGMDVDLELALFHANHGNDEERALAETLARQAYAARATVYTADALGWALFRNGKAAEAWPYSQEALRLGTSDALLYTHAAQIAEATGRLDAAAAHAARALAINPLVDAQMRPMQPLLRSSAVQK